MNIALKDDIRFINKFLYSVQKHRISLGNWIDAKKRDKIHPSKNALLLYDKIEEQEKIAKKIARTIVSESPIWEEFFMRIHGIGEMLATSLMAEIQDISRFPTITSLFAYSGLTGEYVIAQCSKGHKLIMSSDKHKTCIVRETIRNESDEENEETENIIEKVLCGGIITPIEYVKGKAPKRKTGHHFLFNTNIRTIAWKICAQFLKQGDDFYKEIYYKEKERLQNINQRLFNTQDASMNQRLNNTQCHNVLSKGHIHNRACRKMSKIFLSHLWEAWRISEGLPMRIPYEVEKLGHTGYIHWQDAKARLKPKVT